MENQAPVAAPDRATVDAGESVRIPVLVNDTDDGLPEGSEVAVVGVGQAAGRLTYTPRDVTFHAATGDAGEYFVKYRVSDGELEATGDITVHVRAAPQRSISIDMAAGPVALRSYALHGRVRPEAASANADVIVQRRTSDGWTRFARTPAGAEGRWSVPFRTNTVGKRVFRARTSLRDDTSAVSRSISRTVRARADVKISGPLTRQQVPFSWRAGCPVPPSSLRKVTINRYDYRRLISRGTVVVRASAVSTITRVLSGAIDEGFPVRSMRPTDAFYAGGSRTPVESDKAAMRAGNTSAFNCRPVVGNPYRISQHSYGNAIDINTIENPYVTGGQTYPAGSGKYLDRSPYRRGMILSGGVIASRMRSAGWLWGARWSHPDYQHFSSNGG